VGDGLKHSSLRWFHESKITQPHSDRPASARFMQISMSSATRTSHIDRIGAGVSFVCAVHCALMPFVIALLPFAGHSFLADGRLENIIVAISITLAGLSVWAGIRVHGEKPRGIQRPTPLTFNLRQWISVGAVYDRAFLVEFHRKTGGHRPSLRGTLIFPLHRLRRAFPETVFVTTELPFI
jgi:MerC mercury resistance protein